MAWVQSSPILLTIYEGNEDPKKYWFICKIIQTVKNTIDLAKQMGQFGAAMKKKGLTWHMTLLVDGKKYTKNQINLLTFFKTLDAKHFAA